MSDESFQDQCGYNDHHFQLKEPDKTITKYSVRVGDEALIAPMAMFYPDMFGLHGDNLTGTNKRQMSQPEDVFDGDYLKQTQSNQERVQCLICWSMNDQKKSY